MKNDSLLPDTLVADILNRWPPTQQVFLRHRMACLGCEMAGFETLASAAEIYHLPLERLIAELQVALVE
jgi:hybrid cluster-associated redox disulfide protein